VFVALIQGVVGGIGFLIFGLEGYVLWGFVMALLSLFPVIGAFLVWVPASIILLISNKIWQGIGLFLYGAIIISYIDNISRMKVFASIGKIHPLITLFGILIGLPYFGIIGIIMGPLLVALFLALLKIFKKEYIDR
jgi:predicted PurR-regulated permease PerM